MTRSEANMKAIHFGCGGILQVVQQPLAGTVIWIVGVGCVKCGHKVITHSPYRRWLHGDEAMTDRRQRAIADFNAAAPWEVY